MVSGTVIDRKAIVNEDDSEHLPSRPASRWKHLPRRGVRRKASSILKRMASFCTVAWHNDKSAPGTGGKLAFGMTLAFMKKVGFGVGDFLDFRFGRHELAFFLTKTDVYVKGKTLKIIKATKGRMYYIYVPWTHEKLAPTTRGARVIENVALSPYRCLRVDVKEFFSGV